MTLSNHLTETPEPIGSWADNPCWYVSVQDAGRTSLVLGPFRTEAACREWAYYTESTEPGGSPKHSKLIQLAEGRDCRSWFYAWGMTKMANGYRSGVLNSAAEALGFDAQRDMQAAVANG